MGLTYIEGEKLLTQIAEESGLSIEILIEARVSQFRGGTDDLKRKLGFAKMEGLPLLKTCEGLIEFPYYQQDGSSEFSRFKLVPPLSDRKYLQPKGTACMPYILPRIWEMAEKTNHPLWIVEGEKKALKLIQHGEAAIALPGVWQFRDTAEIDPDQQDLSKELQAFAWRGRTVFLGFDADLWVNPQVRAALWELAVRLAGKNALVKFATWEVAEGRGVDDFLIAQNRAGRTVTGALEDLKAAAQDIEAFICADHQDAVLRALAIVSDLPDLKREQLIKLTSKALGGVGVRTIGKELDRIHRQVQDRAIEKAGVDLSNPYRIGQDGTSLWWAKPSESGRTMVQLSNFVAEIIGDTVEDDGAETRRKIEMCGVVSGQASKRRFSIPAEKFERMEWVIPALGSDATITSSRSLKDRVREAIQRLSCNTVRRQVFTHLGWREIEGQPVYLHGGGGIGAHGAVEGIDVLMREELARYVLPLPPSREALISAVRASLRILDLAPDHVSAPVFCAPWRPIIPIPCDFTPFLVGRSGRGKSELAALAQQHYGAGMDAHHLPGSWASTGNALEGIAFLAKDALLVVDDFAPHGSTGEVQRLHAQAERVLRAQGNLSGRQRLKPDGTHAVTRHPRGQILSTGEDVPVGQSLRSRLAIVEVAEDDVIWDRLTSAQTDAAQGLYAQAMAGFVQWVAGRFDEVAKDAAQDFLHLRGSLAQAEEHKRTAANQAQLLLGLEFFLSFAAEIGAVSEEERSSLWIRSRAGLARCFKAQAQHLKNEDPVDNFLNLLGAALASGEAHVIGKNALHPDEPEKWGWRATKAIGYEAQGVRIGWLLEDGLFLIPEAVFKAAQKMVASGGQGITITANTLWKRCHERRLLASTGQGRLVTRRTIDGIRYTNLVHFFENILDKGDE